MDPKILEAQAMWLYNSHMIHTIKQCGSYPDRESDQGLHCLPDRCYTFDMCIFLPVFAQKKIDFECVKIFMPPTLKKLMGHIAFGAWVRGSHFLYLQ